MDHRRPCSVLLVENSDSDVALILGALGEEDLGGSVEVAANGEAALSFLFGDAGPQNRAGLRLILLDMGPAKASCVEVLRRIKEDPGIGVIPVVMFTSSGALADRTACYALGVNSYLVKPADAQAFSDTVREAVRYWLHLNAVPLLPGQRSPETFPS